MAKLPRAGAVKTRLRGRLTEAQAAALYAAFLDDKVDSVRALEGATPVIAFTPEGAADLFSERYGPELRLLAQRGTDLGERLANAAADLFADGFSAIALLDSDTPNLPTDYLSRTLSALTGGAEVVLGPTSDGGYYLIGMTRFMPELFRGIHWSTPSVAVETLAIARQLGVEAHVLPAWYDIDTPADLDRLADDLFASASGNRKPANTLRVMASIALQPAAR
jgi:uncharacterized protein